MPGRITPAQIRGARAMLDWSMVDLARAAGLSISTVKRMERAAFHVVSNNAFATAQAAFESAGVRFLADDGEGVGVRLRCHPSDPEPRRHPDLSGRSSG